MDHKRLQLLNEPDIPTHRRGNTIDLSLSNIPGASSQVEDHLYCSSDHSTISILVPAPPSKVPPPKLPRVRTPEQLERYAEVVEYI
ncbi:hypothetical protein E4U52_003051, partial [Claviceps spartinae]